MFYLIIKALLSGVIVAAVSEIAKRWPGLGGLVASLPLVSVLGMMWLWRDTHDPERMAALRAMGRTSPADAGEQLPRVTVPVLVVMGSADPDWADPRVEGEGIVAALPPGLGRLAVIHGAGHCPHVERPDEVVELALPFLRSLLPTGEVADA